MDTLSIILGAGFIVFALFAFYLSRAPKGKTQKKKEDGGTNEVGEVRRPEPLDENRIVGGRRVVRQRNRPQRPRVQDAFDHSGSDSGPEEMDDMLPDVAFGDGSIGAKKRKKLEAKADKRAQRQAELTEREEKKEREARLEEERKKKEALEKLSEEERLEQERLEKEEQERKEHEEYLKLKESFQIVEEGLDEQEDLDSQNMLQEFIEYVKLKKVVLLEDLAAKFKLRTQDCIDRILKLQNEGHLTGVIDDRGKFIYISMDELQAVAKFVKQRGRVSISDLAESSNKLIKLQTA